MSRSYLCNGNVSPSRFIKLDTSKTGGWVLQAGAGDVPIGVSQPGVRQPPLAGLDDGYAGVQGVNQIESLEAEDEGWLQAGAAVTLGDLLKPDSSGRGVTASSDGNVYGALALETATAADQLIRVRVLAPSFRGA